MTTESPSNHADISALKGRLELYYAGFLLIAALFVVPIDSLMGVGMLLMIVLIIALYRLRGKEKKIAAEEEKQNGVLQAQFLVTLFWRFSYLSVVSIIVTAAVVFIWGDGTVIDEMQASIASGHVLVEQEMADYMERYKQANVTISKIGHMIGFVPLAAYIFYRLWYGWTALKAGLPVSPKAWRS